MTAPSEPVRPADEETVQALAEDTLDDLTQAIYDGMDSRNGTWAEAIVYARAVVASKPWQRLVREIEEMREDLETAREAADDKSRIGHAVANAWQQAAEQAIRERDEARADLDLAITAASRLAADNGQRWSLDQVLEHFGLDRAALRGDAEEASDGR